MQSNYEKTRVHVEFLESRRLLSFSPAVGYLAGAAPQAVATGDFNGDARPDLAVHNSDFTVSVLLGNANGTFQPAQSSPSASGLGGPPSIAVGDFNRDGKPDLVTCDWYSVNLLLGNGNGTFRAPVGVLPPVSGGPGDSHPVSVAAGDVNGDGTLDLAVALIAFAQVEGYGGATANVLLGRGDGSFQPAQSRAVGGFYPDSACVTVGDFNSDGKSDVAMAVEGEGGSRGIAVVLGAAGGFGSAFDYYVPDTVFGLAARDVNGDGKPDLVAVGRRLNVLLGTGGGTLGPNVESAAPRDSYIGPGSFAMEMADFNGDLKLDIVTVDYQTGSANVQLGSGSGTFGPAIVAAAGTGQPGVAVGDFNGDGRPDLASANAGSDAVSVLLNDGDWPGANAPAWLAAGSAATWNPATKALTVTGAATIIGDPGVDAPVITATGAATVLTINPSSGRAVRVGGLTLTGGATVTLTSVTSGAAPAAAVSGSPTKGQGARGGAVKANGKPKAQLASAAAALRTAANSRVLVVNGNTFTIDASSKLDLTDNNLILNYSGASPAAGVEGMVKAGFNSGTWLGKRITSSSANADRKFALAVSDNSRLAIPFTSTRLFAGETVDATSVLVKFTHRVDLDLDGVITSNDATIFNSNYSAGRAARWGTGDVDFDGLFTSNDATLFNSYYDESLGAA